jgi:hypothetical protein
VIRASLTALVVFALQFGLTPASAQIGVLPAQSGNLRSTTDSRYRAGDVWEYTTRHGEEQSRLTIVKVERSSQLGIIIHLALDRLTWKTCQGDPSPQQVPHMPFDREAVEHSVTHRVGSVRSLPNYEDGYNEWKNAFLNGHAGIYTISVKDAVSMAETTWRTGMGCEAKPQ